MSKHVCAALLAVTLMPTLAGAQPGTATGLSAQPAHSVNFTWAYVPGATWYYLWVTDASGVPRHRVWYTSAQANCGPGGSAVCEIDTSMFLLPGTATWWVQAYSDTGGYGAWTAAHTFPVPGPLFAVVSPLGTLMRGNAVSVTKLGTGNYEVAFGREVSSCTYTAIIGGIGTDVEPPGFVTVSRRTDNSFAVYVATWSTGSGLQDRPFHLTVNCN